MFLEYFTLFSALNFAIYFVIFLFRKTTLTLPNRLLSLIFLNLTIYSIFVYWNYAGVVHNYKNVLHYYIPLDYILGMFLGPLMYVYVKSLLHEKTSFKLNRTILHGLSSIPATAYVIYYISFPSEERIELLYDIFNNKQHWFNTVLVLLFYVQLTTYLYICYRKISKQTTISPVVIFDNTYFNIVWLKYFLLISLIILFGTLPICIALNNERMNTIIAQIAMNTLFIYFYIRILMERGLFMTEDEIKNNQKLETNPLKISDESASIYIDKLISLIETEKIYLNEQCTLHDIAEKLDLSYHQLSHIINAKLKVNYSDFINEYRIKHAQNLLTDPNYAHYTIEAIGNESGFGSKTAFHKVFKKHTQTTPFSFREKKK